ncbi:uncharacterized protein LOC134015577 [Osmerus eperlanus]|uniref:uncharacterized protein LOC134015577 n=1 Tax=Osmerus eperlanus TaxID=29151 RepID=UPI002E12123B
MMAQMMACHLLIVWLLVLLCQQGSQRYIPSPPGIDPAFAAEPYERHSSPLSSLDTSPGSSPLSSLDTSPGSSPISSLDTSPGSSPISSLDTSPGSSPVSSLDTSPGSSPLSSQEIVSAPSTPFTSSTPSPLDLIPTQLAPPPAYSHLNTTDVHSNPASDPDNSDEDLVVDSVGRTTSSDTDAPADPSLTYDPSLIYDPSDSEEGSADVWLEEELEEEASRNFISHNATLLHRPLIESVTDAAMATDFGDATHTKASMATTYSYWDSDNMTEANGNHDDIQDVDVVDLLPVIYSSDDTVTDVAEGSYNGEGSGGSCSFSGPAEACSSSETKIDSTESLGRHGDDKDESTSGPVSNSPLRDSEAMKGPIAAFREPTLSSNQDGVAVTPDDVISTSQSQGEALPPLSVATPTPPASGHVEPGRGILGWVRDLFLWRQSS